jgi:Fe2+ or Zn2+ uptake regulation protein
MLSTIHRRHILSLFEKEKTQSQKSLKSLFVDSGEMNQTTLYRILEKFHEEGLLHRVDFQGEKYFTLCQCATKKEEAVKLKCCVNCHTIEENHSALPPLALKSETIELVKNCEKCK